MNETKVKNEVQVEVTVNGSAEKAFRVFTERCNDWWPSDYKLGETDRKEIIMEPHVGGRWYERDADGVECEWGRVLAWAPPHHLVISWQIGVGFVPNQNPKLASRVEIRFIEDRPNKTTIKLIHSQFEKHGKGWETMRDSIAGDGGWLGLFKHLKSLMAEAG